MAFRKEDMARRAAAEIAPGSIVNLGIGLPTLCADYLPEGDATVITKLIEAGAIILGKTTMPDFATTLTAEDSVGSQSN